ncbi:MAG: anti-sigma factor family protein [Dehalococcoidia bacterium]
MTLDVRNRHRDDLLPAYLNGSLGSDDVTQVKEHLLACTSCTNELAEWEAVGQAIQTMAAGAATPPRGLLDRVWLKIDDEAVAPTAIRQQDGAIGRLRRRLSGTGAGRLKPVRMGTLAAALAGILLIALVGTQAQGFLSLFQPKQFVPVSVTLADLQTLPSLQQYGDVSIPQKLQSQDVPDAIAASAASGMTVLTPATLPAGAPPSAKYTFVPGGKASFAFSAAKAQAAVAAQGKALPSMPANIDGSTLIVTTGSVVVSVYGGTSADNAAIAGSVTGSGGASSAEAVAKPVQAGGSGTAAKSGSGLPDLNGLPKLVIGQAKAPTIDSTGASVTEIEKYLLNQPGISPALAAQIKAIADPSTTWPIPIPINLASAHTVRIPGQGVDNALSIADNTGIGGGILWEKDGIIYAVAGPLTEKELVNVASSLR